VAEPSSQQTSVAPATVLMTQFPHLAAKLADRGPQSQGTTSHTSAAATTRNNITQYVTDLLTPVQNEDTAAEFWQQKIATNSQSAVPLIAQDMISAPASQAFVERLFSVCGLLTVGRRNRMEKSLNMRAWLKVNYDELQDLL